MQSTIFIIDDEEEMCISLSEIISSKGYKVIYTTDPLKVNRILINTKIDLILLDIRMPKLGGINLLKIIKKKNPFIPIIMITGYPSIDNAVHAMKYGALNFYVKPLKIRKLLDEIKQILNSQQKRREIYEDHRIITENPKMIEILKNLRKVASTNATILLIGETGTGKELAAEYVHYNSDRRNKPFIKVNCAAIPDNLLESELFGYEKGAFTDAINVRIGKFELANYGTIFLDEIGDMSLETQPKILRVLQEKEFERLGGNKIFKIDTRIISATNKNINKLIKSGSFREDLFYRLSVVTIDIPPLRERKEDVMILAEHFLNYFNRIYGRGIKYISEDVKNILIQHDWPGNIRELKNCIERAVIFCEKDTISIEDLPSQYKDISLKYEMDTFQDLQNSLNRAIISEALKKCKGNKRKAAELLNIHRKTLYNRMKKLGMV